MTRTGSIVLYALLFVSAAVPAESQNPAFSDADTGIQPGIYCSSSIGMINEPAEQITDCPYTAAVSYPEAGRQLMKLYHQGELSYSREHTWGENGKTETIRTVYPEKTIEEQFDEQGRLIRELKKDARGTTEIRYIYSNGLLVQAEKYIDAAAVSVFSVTRNNGKALRMMREVRVEENGEEKEEVQFLMLAPEAAAVGTSASFYVWKEEGNTEIQEKWEDGILIQSVRHSYAGGAKAESETILHSGTRIIQLFKHGNLISEEIRAPEYQEITEYRYAENGRPAEIIKRIDGNSSRVLFTYSSANELQKKTFYEDGVITRIETYADGTLQKTDIYSNGRLIISRDHENN